MTDGPQDELGGGLASTRDVEIFSLWLNPEHLAFNFIVRRKLIAF